MGGYRFSNPNYSSMGGTIGAALNRAAGSVDNIAIAMMRNAKTPEERALMDAHQATYNAQARKLAAEADGQEILNQNTRDPLGAIAQAMFGGDRDRARSDATDAINFANGSLSGPVLPQHVEAVPQITRRMDAVTMANLTDPKSIAKVMQSVLTEQQLGDMAAGKIAPQQQAVLNYASGNSANKPWDIDAGGLKIGMASGDVSDTSVSRAANAEKLAAANRNSAAAGMDAAHAALYRAEADNEKNGTPGRTGGGRGAGEKPETAAQRMAREAKNEETMRARQRVQDLIESGVSIEQLRNSPKGSQERSDIVAGSRALIGADDPGYESFAKSFGDTDKATVAEAITAAQKMGSIPGRLWGTKYNDAEVKAEIKKQFPRLSPAELKSVMERSKAGGNNQQQPATAQQPQRAALPAQAVAQLKENVQTKFGNGQVWTLQNGQPVRVQ